MLNHTSGPFIIAKGAPPPHPHTPSHSDAHKYTSESGWKGRCGDAIWAWLSALVTPVNVLSAGGTPSRPLAPAPWLIRPICRDSTWVPPLGPPDLHAVTYPPNSCQKHSMKVPQRWISMRSGAFLPVCFKSWEPLKGLFICCEHTIKSVQAEAAFNASLIINKSSSTKPWYLDLITTN